MSHKTVGYGLIGCGAISVQHTEAIAATPGARLAAVASRSAESSRMTGERWAAPWYTDVRELLARPDVDVAVICTPSGLHAEQALLALEHGKHVLIEKPIALSLADADRVLAAGRAGGLQVAVVSQRRLEPALQTLHTALRQGALGQIVLVEAAVRFWRDQAYYDSAQWRGTVAMDGGAVLNQGIHLVDLLRWLMGPVHSVAGHTATLLHRMEAEDVATASIRFASGALATLTATTCAYPGFSQELRIYGQHGYVHLIDQALAAWEVPGVPAPAAAAGAGTGAADPRAIGSVGHARQYADLTAALQRGQAPAVTGEHGRQALALALAVYESSQTGKSITLEGEQP